MRAGVEGRPGGNTSDDDRIVRAFRTALARRPGEAELAVLRRLLREQRAMSDELSAWTMVASAILNLDETLTKG